MLIDSVESCLVLKSFQYCFLALRQSFFYARIFDLRLFCLSSVDQSAFSFFKLFISFRWFFSLLVHHGLFKSLGLFLRLGQCGSIALFIWEYHWSRHFSSRLVVMLSMFLIFVAVKDSLKSFQFTLTHFRVGGMFSCSIAASYLIELWSEKLGFVLTLQCFIETEILAVNVTSMIELPVAAWKVGVLH